MSGISGLTEFGLSFTSIKKMLSKLPTTGLAVFENAKEYPKRNHYKSFIVVVFIVNIFSVQRF